MEEFAYLDPADIKPNKINPRKNIEKSPGFSELVKSVIEQGVVSPILVRPNGKGYEVVYGERRLLAVQEANAQGAKALIPCRIQKMTDAEMERIMMVENYHRENLTQFDEAKWFFDKFSKDEEALDAFSKSTGIRKPYIMNRIRVMKLPAKITKYWKKGEISYSQLEQFARLLDRKEALQSAISEFEQMVTYRDFDFEDIEMLIDSYGVSMDTHEFNQEECKTCAQCSDTQATMFELFSEGARCFDSKCMMKKIRAQYEKNWKNRKHYKKGIKRFAFDLEIDRDEIQHTFYDSHGPIRPECKACEHLMVIFSLSHGNESDVCYGGSRGWYGKM